LELKDNRGSFRPQAEERSQPLRSKIAAAHIELSKLKFQNWLAFLALRQAKSEKLNDKREG